jgi:hypothetical protein
MRHQLMFPLKMSAILWYLLICLDKDREEAKKERRDRDRQSEFERDTLREARDSGREIENKRKRDNFQPLYNLWLQHTIQVVYIG